MKRRVALGAIAVALILAVLGWYSWGARHTPASQPELVSLDAGNSGSMVEAFNRDASSVRILLLLSPT